MLDFNIKRLFDQRGIDKPYTFLVKRGFVAQTATNLANNQVGYIKPAQMEKLCLLLNCTPNDLFDWRPDKNDSISDNHALRSLVRTQNATSVAQLVNDIPADKLEKLAEMVTNLNRDKKNIDA